MNPGEINQKRYLMIETILKESYAEFGHDLRSLTDKNKSRWKRDDRCHRFRSILPNIGPPVLNR